MGKKKEWKVKGRRERKVDRCKKCGRFTTRFEGDLCATCRDLN